MTEQQNLLDSFYRTIIDSVYDMIFLHDLEGNIIDVNEKVLNSVGYTREELLDLKVFDLHPDSDEPRYNQQNIFQAWEECGLGESVEFEVVHVSKDGTETPVEINAGKVAENGQEYMIAFVRDVSQKKAKDAKIEYLIYHDVLTDIYNRRYLEEKLEEIDDSMLPLSIIMGDLNGLKIINNSHGHTTGDKVLKKAAKIILEVVPDEATVARFGGDEFVILLPEIDNVEGHEVLDEIKDRCRETEADDFPVSIGMGMATKTDLNQDIRQVFEKADREMNQNKLLETRSANNKIVRGLLGALQAKSDETG